MRSRATRPFAILSWLMLAPSVLAAAGDGWLDVRDFGASGSTLETKATTTAGSKDVTVADPGDFRAGQGVMVSRAYVHYTKPTLWGPDFARPNPLTDDVMEMRGYDGRAGSWCVYLLEVNPAAPAGFRWTDDIGRTWHDKTPITHDWQALSGGVEVRFNRRAWDGGYAISFSARDQLVSSIEKIEGNKLTLKDAANRSAGDAVVRHCDDAAIQAAVDRALAEKRNVFFPAGLYRLANGITVKDAAAITLQGQSGVDTVLDVSSGDERAADESTGVSTSCFKLLGGREVTLRNFRMVGHSGYADRDWCGAFGRRAPLVRSLWGFYLKGCNAVTIRGTERVLVENCHGRRMASECFYSQSTSRSGLQEPKAYTKEITYLRCSAEDCGRNAFNNNDGAENTRVLYCRIRDVGGCSWEGASRFVDFVGNYVRNGGTVAMGNVGSRAAHLEELERGQHVVADNVFESGVCYGHCAIRAACGARQVVIRNNLFVNFGSSAIEISGMADDRHLPAGVATVTGNILDMTEVGPEPAARTAIHASASQVLIGDNQIYTRGGADPLVTAIRLSEPAVDLVVHDNLIRNCGTGVATGRGEAAVAEVVSPTAFRSVGRGVPLERRQSHCYRGWNLAWLGAKGEAVSVIEAFDPETLQFQLRQARGVKVGERFEVFAPSANWSIHDNTITGCLNPMVLDSHGSPTSLVKNNLIARGEVSMAGPPIDVRGRFQLIGNQFQGFDEKPAIGAGK